MNDLHIHIKDSEVALHLGYDQILSGIENTRTQTLIFSGDTKGVELEVRLLCDGKRVGCEEADRAVAALGAGWRLETPHELFRQVNYGYRNANGAYSRDESILPLPYWTNQDAPWSSEARVVVLFSYGYVDGDYRNGTALARAVRVSGQ